MRITSLFFILILTGLFACQPEISDQNIDLIISEINNLKQQYAPDKRVAIWNIDAKKNKAGQYILSGESNQVPALNTLKDKLAEAQIDYIDSIRTLPDLKLLEGNTYGIVNLSACNIRSQPKHSAELATQSTLGTVLKVYDRKEGWFRVQTPDGYLGWLDKGGFMLMDEKGMEQWKSSPKAIYQADIGFAYSQAEPNSGHVSDLLAGNILQLGTQKGEYTEVGFPDGRKGFVKNSDLMDYSSWINSREAKVSNIIKDAKAMMGRPYLWGGTSGKAVDCSGFTKTVFYLNGLILPRDASQQVHVGQEINTADDIANLQPGDFLFFGRAANETEKEKITHVAIYLGNSKIIHASGQVKIESLNPEDDDFAPERLKTFVRAKRMLANPEANGIIALSESEWY